MARVRPERKGYDVIIYQQHVDRLKKMQPTVDSGPPREHPLSNKREMDKVIKINYFYLLDYINDETICILNSGENSSTSNLTTNSCWNDWRK